MTQSSILCPGISTTSDPKTGEPIIHYLQKESEESGNLVCGTGGCKFMYRNKDGQDVWQSDYVPATIPKPL